MSGGLPKSPETLLVCPKMMAVGVKTNGGFLSLKALACIKFELPFKVCIVYQGKLSTYVHSFMPSIETSEIT